VIHKRQSGGFIWSASGLFGC